MNTDTDTTTELAADCARTARRRLSLILELADVEPAEVSEADLAEVLDHIRRLASIASANVDTLDVVMGWNGVER